jgi:hypothetical protein
MPLLPIILYALPVALLFAASATAFTSHGGSSPDVATSVSATPYPSAETVLPIEATFESTPTAGTEALFSVEVSEPWSFHSGDCGFAAAGVGRAEVVADITQRATRSAAATGPHLRSKDFW